MRSRPVVLVLVWLAGAVVATSVGLLAVRQVAAQVGDPAVPAGTGVVEAPSPVPTRSPTRTAPATTSSRTFTSVAGTVGVQCSGSAARLLYATPADGYALDEQSVVGSELEVRFEGRDTRVRMDLSCAGGQARLVDQRTDARD